MLVLRRKIGEKIQIGGQITVTVQRISGNRVSLSIEAPREVRILRGELEPFENAFPERADRLALGASEVKVNLDETPVG